MRALNEVVIRGPRTDLLSLLQRLEASVFERGTGAEVVLRRCQRCCGKPCGNGSVRRRSASLTVPRGAPQVVGRPPGPWGSSGWEWE
jgi:hypothetical protein